MKRALIILITVAATSVFSASPAQQRTVTGTVADYIGNPMVGVTVLEEGTLNATATDIRGVFSINVRGASTTLIFRLPGYLEEKVSLGEGTRAEVTMREDAISVEEIVVVGYGTQRRASVVGSISSTSGSELQRSAASNLTQTIGGRISGVFTRTPGGRPGEDNAHVFIRGLASYNDGANAPLSIVDGVEREYAQIDPEDIESFTVLKDASATAVYGVRGANGVIIITTKRGMTAKPQVEFRATLTGSNPTRLPEKLGSYDYARLKNEALANVGQAMEYGSRDMDLYRTGASPFTHPDNDYVGDMLNDFALKQQYNLVVRGGTPFVRYYASVNFLNDDGIYKTFDNDDYDTNVFFRRYGLRTNLDFNVTRTTTVGVDISGRLEERHNNGYGDDLFQSLVRTPPNHLNYVNPDGSLGGSNINLVNPYAALSRWGYQHSKRNVFEVVTRINQSLDFITEGLRARAMYSYVSTMKSRRDLVEKPELKYYSKDGEYKVIQAQQAIAIETKAADQGPYTRNVSSEIGLDYNREFGNHKVTALGLINQSQYYENARLPVSFINYVARVTYEYGGRYLAEFNFGANGSMNFAKGSRYGRFPAFSAGWVPSNESFWKSLKAFPYLKIRGSYGEVGNDKFGNYSYFYQNLYPELTSNRPTFGVTQNVVNRVYEGRLGNTSVSWERSTKANIGIDARFLSGRLSFTGDIFHERRRGILSIDESIPTILGMLDPKSTTKGLAPHNIGKVVNRGFEIELGWDDTAGKVRYYVNGNFSFARNKIIEDGQAPQTYPWLRTAGNNIGQRFGLICDGFYNSQEEIDALPSGFTSNLKPGDLKYRDINGDGRTDNYDIMPIGRTQVPEIMYGVTMGVDFAGFDLQLFWQGATNADIYVNGYGYWEFINTSSVMAHHLGRWTPDNMGNATYPSLTPSVSEQNHRLSTFWLKNASYLRLKNTQLGYTIPQRITRHAGISNLRLYVGATNLLTFSNFKEYDPESSDGDGSAYPQMRQFTAGVSVKF